MAACSVPCKQWPGSAQYVLIGRPERAYRFVSKLIGIELFGFRGQAEDDLGGGLLRGIVRQRAKERDVQQLRSAYEKAERRRHGAEIRTEIDGVRDQEQSDEGG